MISLETLPPGVRRLVVGALGLAFLLTVFVFLPRWALALSGEVGWPRWPTAAGRAAGAALVAAGVAALLHCAGLFARLGRGTPMPLAPPQRLVAAGLYRHSRNPIYVAQVAVLLGYFGWFGDLALLLYALSWAGLVHLFVTGVEEPELRERFGADYDAYAARVPRWLGLCRRRNG